MTMSRSLCSAFTGLSVEARTPLHGGPLSAVPRTPLVRSGSLCVEAAHKKGAGSTKNGRDSISKRRGVKVYGMQKVKAGGIIMRQLGTKFHPGENAGLGRDYTIFAKQEGIVFFESGKDHRKLISVYDPDHPKILAKLPPPPPRNGPTRRERWLAKHTPRATQREQALAMSNHSKPSSEC